MVDTVTTATMGNDNDDWEVAVDTGEFDKRLEQQEKARVANQEPVVVSTSFTVNDDDSQASSSIDLMKSNKPIRILKRPTIPSSSQINNDITNSLSTTTTNTNTASTAKFYHTNNTNNSNLPFSNNISSSTTVPVVSIIPRNQTDSLTNSSQSIPTPTFSLTSSSLQSTKPAIKTYEQRELEYRLARLRIMGEEESSVKDDDDDVPTVEATSVSTDEIMKPISCSSSSSTSSSTKTTNTMSELSQQQQQPLQCHSTPGSYASNLYTLNNVPLNTDTIHFTPNNNSTPTLGTGSFSSPNFSQHYRGPYSHMPPSSVPPRYPLPSTTTTTLFMTSTAPYASAPSSSSNLSSSYHYPSPEHPNMTTNNWYSYQHQSTPYETQQYGHPQ